MVKEVLEHTKKVRIELEQEEYEIVQQIIFCYLNYSPSSMLKKEWVKLAKEIYN